MRTYSMTQGTTPFSVVTQMGKKKSKMRDYIVIICVYVIIMKMWKKFYKLNHDIN